MPANGMIVGAPDGLLLVDTTWTEGQAERLITWAEKTTGSSLARAIVTDSHADWSGGVAALYRKKGIPVVALDLTVARLRAAGGAELPGVLMKAEPRAQASGPGFEAFYPGAGHTGDNIVVWFPGARILFGGCLIKAETAPDLGNIAEADRASWPRAEAAVRDRYPNAEVVVPGRGPVGGLAALSRTLELLRARAASG